MNLRPLITLTFLGAAFCLVMAGMAGAQPTEEMNSTGFDYKYEFDVDPTDSLAIDLDGNELADWAVHNAYPDLTTEPGIAKFAQKDEEGLIDGYACKNDGTIIWPSDITDAYTFEVSVKPITDSPTYSGNVYVTSPSEDKLGHLLYSREGQYWDAPGGVISLGSDVNYDTFHVFRIAKEEGDNYWVWRDDVLLNPDGEALHGKDNDGYYIGFQRGTGSAEGEVDADYFRFTAGAYAPVGGSLPPIPGDANDNGIVDDEDASILAAHWQQSGGWADGDFNNDGIVNDQDASILAAHWLETQGDATAPIPEPSTVVLLTFAAVSLLVWRRRK